MICTKREIETRSDVGVCVLAALSTVANTRGTRLHERQDFPSLTKDASGPRNMRHASSSIVFPMGVASGLRRFSELPFELRERGLEFPLFAGMLALRKKL